MEWVERVPRAQGGVALPGPSGQVFFDPHGHRLRRLRHASRVAGAAAATYLALLALGLAGPATPPFSLFPGAKAGESGTEAVRTGTGPAGVGRARDAGAGADVLTGRGVGSPAPPGGPAGA